MIEDDKQTMRERRSSNRPSTIPGTQAGPSEYEAERWRAGGGFTRAEVNVTRSGGFKSAFTEIYGRHCRQRRRGSSLV